MYVKVYAKLKVHFLYRYKQSKLLLQTHSNEDKRAHKSTQHPHCLLRVNGLYSREMPQCLYLWKPFHSSFNKYDCGNCRFGPVFPGFALLDRSDLSTVCEQSSGGCSVVGMWNVTMLASGMSHLRTLSCSVQPVSTDCRCTSCTTLTTGLLQESLLLLGPH